MKRPILYIVIGVLAIISGLRHNQYRLIPEFLYYVFGGFLIVSGIYKLLTSASGNNKE